MWFVFFWQHELSKVFGAVHTGLGIRIKETKLNGLSPSIGCDQLPHGGFLNTDALIDRSVYVALSRLIYLRNG